MEGPERKSDPVSSQDFQPLRPPGPDRATVVRALLVKLRVDGAALEAFVACEFITGESLLRDVQELEADKGVRSVKRVLVDRLRERHGIAFTKGGKSVGVEAIRQVEDLRERARAQAVADADEVRAQAEKLRGRVA